MKVCKRYHDLVKMYHFNPINDWELFENMETQYLYGPKDVKKPRMHQYVYWYNPDKKLKKDEIKKDYYFNKLNKYVFDNMNKLEEWCGKKYL